LVGSIYFFTHLQGGKNEKGFGYGIGFVVHGFNLGPGFGPKHFGFVPGENP
jgi:hypothetical protein